MNRRKPVKPKEVVSVKKLEFKDGIVVCAAESKAWRKRVYGGCKS